MIILVAILSIVLHFLYFGYPASVVFDEVHNGNFITNYWHGTYFFDVHPPLAKLLESGFGYLLGANNNVADYTNIGNSLPSTILLLRLLPMIAGILLPIIVYYILRKFEISKASSITIAILLTLENSLLVQSRFIIFDSIMIVFGFLSILVYLKFIENPTGKNYLYLLSTALLAAAAFGIKWTGLAFFLIIFILEFRRLRIMEGKIWKPVLKKIIYFSFIFGFIITIFYVSLFAIHFALLPKSGQGDDFMSQQFQKTLIGNHATGTVEQSKESFLGKFTELNFEMFKANLTLTVDHPYSSKWYTWPVMQRSIFYWQGSTASSSDTVSTYIYLLGNPFIYLIGGVSIVFIILSWIITLFQKNQSSPKKKESDFVFFVVVGYLANFLPFIFIGRVMFLYHYQTALIFSIISLAYFAEQIETKKKLILIAIVVIATLTFIYFAPLTYGLPLSSSELATHMWLPSWR